MHNKKILVVDDDPISRILLSKVLDAHSYTYTMVSSAIEAFEALSDKSFSVILMDIEMPDTDGLEAARFIRQLNADYFQNIPIIALTAHKMEDIQGLAVKSGMDKVVNKPIDIDELLSALASTVNFSHTVDKKVIG